jgi:hypothetical protein
MKNNRLIVLILSTLLFYGCNNTVGRIELAGKVLDADTKAAIPNISIMVEGLDQTNEEYINRFAGDFMTDSSGCFTFMMKKVKNASYYTFRIEGNPDYAETNKMLGLSDLHTDGKFLSFQMKRIVDFTIKINRVSKTTYQDMLTVSWKTDGVDGQTFYPYKIVNYCINSEKGLVWAGGEVKSEIKTKVFADRKTIVHWELFRNGKSQDIVDTLFCLRDAVNSINLNY